MKSIADIAAKGEEAISNQSDRLSQLRARAAQIDDALA